MVSSWIALSGMAPAAAHGASAVETEIRLLSAASWSAGAHKIKSRHLVSAGLVPPDKAAI